MLVKDISLICVSGDILLCDVISRSGPDVFVIVAVASHACDDISAAGIRGDERRITISRSHILGVIPFCVSRTISSYTCDISSVVAGLVSKSVSVRDRIVVRKSLLLVSGNQCCFRSGCCSVRNAPEVDIAIEDSVAVCLPVAVFTYRLIRHRSIFLYTEHLHSDKIIETVGCKITGQCRGSFRSGGGDHPIVNITAESACNVLFRIKRCDTDNIVNVYRDNVRRIYMLVARRTYDFNVHAHRLQKRRLKRDRIRGVICRRRNVDNIRTSFDRVFDRRVKRG